MAMWVERFERLYADDRRVAMEPVPYATRYQDPAEAPPWALPDFPGPDPDDVSYVYADARGWEEAPARLRHPRDEPGGW